jgi:hypothetical protein
VEGRGARELRTSSAEVFEFGSTRFINTLRRSYSLPTIGLAPTRRKRIQKFKPNFQHQAANFPLS